MTRNVQCYAPRTGNGVGLLLNLVSASASICGRITLQCEVRFRGDPLMSATGQSAYCIRYDKHR